MNSKSFFTNRYTSVTPLQAACDAIASNCLFVRIMTRQCEP